MKRTCSSLIFLSAILLTTCAPFVPHHQAAGISTELRIVLGGIEQRILLRGEDRNKPVLLFLHGGPGVPEMPLSYKNADLERDFVVVHWDQRGAGKSYRPDTPDMRVDRFVEDTLELTRWLCTEFKQPRIYLVGHSWGSLVGAEAVAREPKLFIAYVGISQLVNIAASEKELDRRSRDTARAEGDLRALHRLEQIGPFPYANHADERRVNKIQKNLMGRVPHELSATHFFGLAVTSPYYSIGDYLKAVRGVVFSGKALEKEIYAVNLFKVAPEIDVPVYFLEGRKDTVLSPVTAAQYCKQLVAPRGKHLIWFDNSNHWPQFEEPVKYRAVLRQILHETGPGSHRDR